MKGVISMLKITYYEQPFYCNGIGINQPCTKDLSIEFDQDASATEILNEVVKLLKYAGYNFIDSKKYPTIYEKNFLNTIYRSIALLQS